MLVYQVTAEERAKIEANNEKRTHTLLIVCDLPVLGCCVVYDDIDKVEFDSYRSNLDATLSPTSIKEYTPVEP